MNKRGDILKFEWKIDNETLNEMKTCNHGKLFYPQNNFGINDNFCIFLGPKGIISSDQEHCVLFLQLLRLPATVKAVEFDLCFELKGDLNIKWEKNDRKFHRITSNGTFFIFWPDGTFSAEKLQSLTNVSFVATITIKSVIEDYRNIKALQT